MKDNCLTDALNRFRSGGWLVIRRSAHWWAFHVMHVDRAGRLTSYVPRQGKLAHPVMALLGFDGEARDTDALPRDDTTSAPAIVAGSWLMALGATVWGFARLLRWRPWQ